MSNYLLSGGQAYTDSTKDLIANGLPKGAYTVMYDGMKGTTSVAPFSVSSDAIIDLPDANFANLVNEINTFFKKDTQDKYNTFGFVYKKSVLLHGKPGTGKTCLVVKLMQMFDQRFDTGVVLFNPDLKGLASVTSIIPTATPLLVIFEEFDGVCDRYNESYILSLLDGEIQRPNTFYLFTTNFLDKIPKRLFRPGRISNVVEIINPSLEARIAYLQAKMPEEDIAGIQKWAHETDGLTLDDLKHTVLCVKCLDIPLTTAIKNLTEGQKLLDNFDGDDDCFDDPDPQQVLRILGGFVQKRGYE